jgi:hypothetical protein
VVRRLLAYAVRNMPATRANDGSGLITTMRVGLSALLFAGCITYKPGAFASDGKVFVGERATVGCLDLAVARRPDMQAKAVLEFAFGNRCDKPAPVDLAYAKVIGRTADGSERRLIPYDPDSQLMALRLDGRTSGREALAYSSESPLVQVCVDVASIAQTTPERWVCFAQLDQSGEQTVEDPSVAEVVTDVATGVDTEVISGPSSSEVVSGVTP